MSGILINPYRFASGGGFSFLTNVKRVGDGTSSSIDTTDAKLIVCNMSSHSTDADTLSDSKSNTWTRLTRRNIGSVGQISLFYCINPSVGSGHTFTAGGGAFPTLCVAAFGCTGTPVYEAESGAYTAGPVSSYQPGSLTPSVNNCLLVSGWNSHSTPSALSINGDFITTDIGYFVGGTAYAAALAYNIQTTAGAENPTWSWTGSGSAAANMAVFKST